MASAPSNATLGDLMERLVNESNPLTADMSGDVAPGYLNAVALLVLNDGIKIDVFVAATSTKSEEEK